MNDIPQLPGPFWLIGCGNMAGAMLTGWHDAGIDPGQITVIRPSGTPVANGIRVLTHYPEDEVPALAMLGVKPQKLDEVAPELARILDPATILVSILAGVEQQTLRARFPNIANIIRAMPNTLVQLRQGVIGLHSDSADAGARQLVERLMAALGLAEWIDDEPLFQAIAAFPGAGPAFLFRVIDALAAGGEALGFDPAQAARLAAATVAGAAALASASNESPETLANRVASPGGMTRAGLNVLDDGEALKGLLRRTLEAAHRRGLEMAEVARKG